MIPLHTRCRKCGKFSESLPYSIHERPAPSSGWRTVVVSSEEINRYHEYVFCPDCVPTLLKEIPSHDPAQD